jgi:hypothetical protein
MADQQPALMAMAGTKPAGDRNGLAEPGVAKGMIEDPNKLLLCVGLVTSNSTIHRNRTGKVYPIAEWAWIEVAPEGSDVYAALGKALNDLYMERTGAMMAPFIPGGQRPLDVRDDDEEAKAE